MKILIAEGKPRLNRSTIPFLMGQKFKVEVVESCEEAWDMAAVYAFDVLLVSDDLDDMSGIDTVRTLRGKGVDTPAIIYASNDASGAVVRALEAGADDFIVPKANDEELVARMKAVVRRANGVAKTAIELGRLTVDLNQRCILVDGRHVHLTDKEYVILETLALRRGRIVTKEHLMDALYAGQDEPLMKIIDVFVCKLRKKLGDMLGDSGLVETVWGRGYRISETVASARSDPSAQRSPNDAMQDARKITRVTEPWMKRTGKVTYLRQLV